MSIIVHDRAEVFHSIREHFNFDQPVELKAAIFALDKLCAGSQHFVANICEEVGRMASSGYLVYFDINLN